MGAMTRFRTIEIDFDVHKLIENERRGFAEPPNDALRRLLKLPGAMPAAEAPSTPPRRGWSDQGVALPDGTPLRMEYSGKAYEGRIEDGEWVIGGHRFGTPSGAASGVALTKKGKRAHLDGWKYWHAKRPGDDKWVLIDDLREKPGPIVVEGADVEVF
jgi:hypothetical protein